MDLWIYRSSGCLVGFSAASRASFQMNYYEVFNYPFLHFFKTGAVSIKLSLGLYFVANNEGSKE